MLLEIFLRLFVCLFWGFCPIREFFTHIETSPLPMKGCEFDLCLAFMAIEQWGFLSVPHLLCHGRENLFIMIFSKDRCHSHLLLSVWQWSCHYLVLGPRSVAAGIRTPNLPLVGWTLLSHCTTAVTVQIFLCL